MRSLGFAAVCDHGPVGLLQADTTEGNVPGCVPIKLYKDTHQNGFGPQPAVRTPLMEMLPYVR